MKLGRVELSAGFLMLAALLNYGDEQGLFWRGLLCCVIHELGHLVALGLMGVPVAGLRITVFGAEIQLRRGMSYGQEIFAALAGPAANLVLAGVLCRVPGGELTAGVSFALGCFNLLPFETMDGGRCLRSIGSLLFGPDAGWILASGVSLLAGLGASAGGIVLWRMGGNLTLFLMAVWILMGIWKKERNVLKKQEISLAIGGRRQ